MLGLLFAACNSYPIESAQNTLGGASIKSVTQIPMSKQTTAITVEPASQPPQGQIEIADIVSYGADGPAIKAPRGWNLVRDDGTRAVRQSIYSHLIRPNDNSPRTWTFAQPVDVQGAILVLDNVEPEIPIDTTTGGAGNAGITTGSMVTSSDGDLIIAFFATDYKRPELNPPLPVDMAALINQEAKPFEYWLLGTYQPERGRTAPIASPDHQNYDLVAAQIAIRRRLAPAAKSAD